MTSKTKVESKVNLRDTVQIRVSGNRSQRIKVAAVQKKRTMVETADLVIDLGLDALKKQK